MARVLMVGIDPVEVDFSDPALPPGLDADKIRNGIEQAMGDLRAAGHAADQMFIPIDPGQLDGLRDRLARDGYDCVTIGGGVRVPPRNLRLFEAVVNIVAQAKPAPAIGLVATPEEAAEVVARVLR